ncbi:MAG: hypothetical protein R6U32_03765 [Candidatus Woesearchaeota archaeon]
MAKQKRSKELSRDIERLEEIEYGLKELITGLLIGIIIGFILALIVL